MQYLVEKVIRMALLGTLAAGVIGCTHMPKTISVELSESLKEGGRYKPVTVHVIGVAQSEYEQWLSVTRSVDDYFKIGGESEQSMKSKAVLALNTKIPSARIGEDDAKFWGGWGFFKKEEPSPARYLFVLADLRPAPPGTSATFEPRRMIVPLYDDRWKGLERLDFVVDSRAGIHLKNGPQGNR